MNLQHHLHHISHVAMKSHSYVFTYMILNENLFVF